MTIVENCRNHGADRIVIVGTDATGGKHLLCGECLRHIIHSYDYMTFEGTHEYDPQDLDADDTTDQD